MKRKSKGILSINVMLLMFGWMVLQTANHFAFARANGLERTEVKITDFTIERRDGSTANSYSWWENMRLKMSWDASSYQNTLKEGEYFDITLPNNMLFPTDSSATQFDVLSPDGNVVAKAVVKPNTNGGGTVRVTFTKYVENRYNIKGTITLASNFHRDRIKSGEKNNFDVTVNGSVKSFEVPNIKGPSKPTGETLAKWPEKANTDDKVSWRARVNFRKGDFDNVTLSDQLSTLSGDLKGIQFIPESFELLEVEYDDYGEIKKIISQTNISDKVKFNPDKTAFTYELGNIRGKQYFLKYQSTYVNGVKLQNKINFKSQKYTYEDRKSYTNASSGGTGEGDLLSKIKIIKVDKYNVQTRLPGARFKITRLSDQTTFELVTDSKGEAISEKLVPGQYTIKEITPPAGYILDDKEYTVVVRSDEAVIKTAENEVEKVDIPVTKTWNDSNNEYGTRPDSIRVQLFADGQPVPNQVLTLSKDNGWKGKFENLNKYHPGGKTEIVYTVKEVDTVDGYISTEGTKDNQYTVTNSLRTVKINITKKWKDGNNTGKRPQSIQVQLLADNQPIQAPLTLDANNNWSGSWTNLPYQKNGTPIVYTVKEITQVPGYKSSVGNVSFNPNLEGNVEITNESLVDISGKKTWDDANNQDGIRPAKIIVRLLANGNPIGNPIEVSQNTNWEYTFKDLPEFDDNGQKINYSVSEEAVPNYTATIDGYNITNRYTPRKTSISVTKVWDDANDQDGKRPQSIQVQLYADGKPHGAPVTLDVNNQWTYTWDNLDEKANGQVIKYTVKEVGTVAGYITEVGTVKNGKVTITNKHTPSVVSIMGKKTWDDANNQDGKRPNKIKVNLLANGQPTGQSVEVSEATNWQYSFNNLPEYENGQKINYTVTEDIVPDYTATINGYDITNSYKPGKTSVTVTKAWNDANNQDGKRPQSIQVQLYANGKAVGEPVTLDANNKWTHTWSELDEKANGQTIKYTVKEIGTVDGYTTETGQVENGNVTIKNTHIPSTVFVEGQKIWNDANNQDGIRPDKIVVRLYANGVYTGKRVEVSKATNWAYRFENLPEYENGQKIVYSVQEEAVEGYVSTVNGGNITNTHTPRKTQLTVKKVWDDANNQDGKRPQSIQVQLYANGQPVGMPVTLDATNQWMYTWTNLDERANGQLIDYTVKEVGTVDGYTTETGKVESGKVTITNRHTPSITSVAGQKTWDDANNQDGKRPAKIKVNLLANGQPTGQSVEVSAETNWSYSFNNLPEYKDGKKIVYTVTEDVVPDYTTTINGYDITNSYKPGKTSVTVTKAWDDANNQDGIRPQSIQVQLYANGKAVGEPVTLDANNKWTHTWSELDEKANGQTIKYTVKEVGEVAEYITTVGEMKRGNVIITNKHVPHTTSISGQKTWYDANNKDGIRPDKITVRLYANGVEVKAIEVTKETNWTYTFSDLPVNQNGKKINYTIKEDAVPGYTTTINGYNIANHRTPDKPKLPYTGEVTPFISMAIGTILSLFGATVYYTTRKH